MAIDPAKIQVIQHCPTPVVSAKELRGFLGLAGFYRKFVHHFGIISKPLSDLLKKNTTFIWTPDHQQTFDVLKQALVSAPVLALHYFSQTFCIYTDASHAGIGVVLMQKAHPLAFLSKALGPRNQGLSMYEKVYGHSDCSCSVAFLLAAHRVPHLYGPSEPNLAQRIVATHNLAIEVVLQIGRVALPHRLQEGL